MANKRIDMRKVREFLRLHFTQGQSARQGAKIVGIGKTSASEYVCGFKDSGLDYTCVDHYQIPICFNPLIHRQ